jgi:hypothetical protein
MSEILSYLNSPHLVANFQKVFGIESEFESSENEKRQTFVAKKITTQNATPIRLRSTRLNNSSTTTITQNNNNPIKTTTTSTTTSGSITNNVLISPNKLSPNLDRSNGTITLTETRTVTNNGTTTDIGHKRTNSNSSALNNGGSATATTDIGHKRTNSNSGVKKQLINVTDHSDLIANTTIHSRY